MGNCTSCNCRKNRSAETEYVMPPTASGPSDVSLSPKSRAEANAKNQTKSRKQSVSSKQPKQTKSSGSIPDQPSDDSDDEFGLGPQEIAERQKQRLLRRTQQQSNNQVSSSGALDNDNPLSRNSIVIGSVVVVEDGGATPKGLDDMVGANLSVPLGTEIHPGQNESHNESEDVGAQDDAAEDQQDDGTWVVAKSRRRGKSNAALAGASPQTTSKKTQDTSSSKPSTSSQTPQVVLTDPQGTLSPLALAVSQSVTQDTKSLQQNTDNARTSSSSSSRDPSAMLSPLSPPTIASPANSMASPFLPASGVNASPTAAAGATSSIIAHNTSGNNGGVDNPSSSELPKTSATTGSASPDAARGRADSLAQRSLNWYDSDSDDDGYAILTPQMRSPPMGATPTASGSRTPVTGGGGAVRLNAPGRFSLNTNQKVSASHFAASPTNGGSSGGRGRGNSQSGQPGAPGRSRGNSVTGSPSANSNNQGRSANAAAAAAAAGIGSPALRGSGSGNGPRSRTGSISGAAAQTGISLLSGNTTGNTSGDSSNLSWRARLASGPGSPGASNPGTPNLSARASNSTLVPPLPLTGQKSNRSNSRDSGAGVSSQPSSPKLSPSYAARLQPPSK